MTTLRIVAGGEPSDEELAALVAVLSLVQSRADDGGEREACGRWRTAARPQPPHHRDGWLAFARRSALRPGL